MSILGYEVLLIEDNEADAAYIKLALQKKQPPGMAVKWRLTTKPTLGEALRLAQMPVTELILLDLNLPDSTGISTYLSIAKVAQAPVIILTGSEDLNLAIESVTRGAYFYLTKDIIAHSHFALHHACLASIEMYRQAQTIRAFIKERLGEYRKLMTACSACGKWKDPSTNKWLEPRDYIEATTDIRFSDTVCEDCIKIRYAEVVKLAQEGK